MTSTAIKNTTKRGKVEKNAVSRKIESKKKLAKLLAAEYRNPSNTASMKQNSREEVLPKRDGEFLKLLEDAQNHALPEMNGFRSNSQDGTGPKCETRKMVLRKSERMSILSSLAKSPRPPTVETIIVDQLENTDLNHSWSTIREIHMSPAQHPTHAATLDAGPSAIPKKTSMSTTCISNAEGTSGKRGDDIQRGKVSNNGTNAVTELQKESTLVTNCSRAETGRTNEPSTDSALSEGIVDPERVDPLVKSPPFDLESVTRTLMAGVTLRRSGRLINKANTFPNPSRPSQPPRPSQKAETIPNAKRNRVVSTEKKSVNSDMLKCTVKIFQPNNKTEYSLTKENRNLKPKLSKALESSNSNESKTTRTYKVGSDGRKTSAVSNDTKCVKTAARYPNQDLRFMFKSLSSKIVRDPKKLAQSRTCS